MAKIKEEKQVIDFYKSDAIVYDKDRYSSNIGKKISAKQKNLILKLGQPWKNKKILEIGCGTGRLTLEVAKEEGLITGLDSSIEMILISKKKVSEDINQNLQFVNADCSSIPFRNSSFEVCLCINVMNHVPNYEKTIEEIVRVLKPGGILIVNISNLRGLYFPIGLLVNRRRTSIYKNVYTRWDTLNDFKKIYNRLGLEIENIQGGMIYPALNNRLLFCIVNYLDSLVRNSFLKYYAGNLYIVAKKN